MKEQTVAIVGLDDKGEVLCHFFTVTYNPNEECNWHRLMPDVLHKLGESDFPIVEMHSITFVNQ